MVESAWQIQIEKRLYPLCGIDSRGGGGKFIGYRFNVVFGLGA
jgi:hypothetical protein